jgi:hypothetical protein
MQTRVDAKIEVQNDSAKTESFAFSLAILILAISPLISHAAFQLCHLPSSNPPLKVRGVRGVMEGALQIRPVSCPEEQNCSCFYLVRYVTVARNTVRISPGYRTRYWT